jgi:hypothetical protein
LLPEQIKKLERNNLAVGGTDWKESYSWFVQLLCYHPFPTRIKPANIMNFFAFSSPFFCLSRGRKKANSEIRALALTPTRELAQQVHRSFERYSENLQINTVVAYGGASINPQLSALNEGCDILVATPGRLLELVIKELIDLNHLETLVLHIEASARWHSIVVFLGNI